jgi:hypothetical protein
LLDLRKIILAVSQFFEFLHSQGQSQQLQRTPKSIDVRFGPLNETARAVERCAQGGDWG